jgi:hypothetical protein
MNRINDWTPVDPKSNPKVIVETTDGKTICISNDEQLMGLEIKKAWVNESLDRKKLRDFIQSKR